MIHETFVIRTSGRGSRVRTGSGPQVGGPLGVVDATGYGAT